LIQGTIKPNITHEPSKKKKKEIFSLSRSLLIVDFRSVFRLQLVTSRISIWSGIEN